MVKVLLIALVLLIASLTGVCPQGFTEVEVKTGDMVAMFCRKSRGDVTVTWTSHTTEGTKTLTGNMSSAEQRRTGVLLHGRSLVILSASVNHQGNYSCSRGNDQRLTWFKLTVYTTQTLNTYSATCYTREACELYCPSANIPPANIPNITSNGIVWHKEGNSSPSYFSSVKEEDGGNFTCTWSYLFDGHIYNRSFTLELDVQPNEKPERSSVIISPKNNDVFHVDLGSTLVIDCKAELYSEFDEIYWLRNNSFVERNNSLAVFYNSTRKGEEMTASLVLKKVSEEDASKLYTCKLESPYHSSSIGITLVLNPRRSYLPMGISIVSSVVVLAFAAVIFLKFRIHITLFLRDTLGCQRRASDGKNYDAFLMCYKNNTDKGLNKDDQIWMTNVLEERFGYSVCLYDRDVLPGTATPEAVQDCIEQSRTVVLVPTSSDPGLGSGLLSAIHEALVERQTRLVFIKTEETEASSLLPEALQLLCDAGDCVTWKGTRSMTPSSDFWRQVRYHLPAPQHAPKIRLLPQKV